MKAILFHVKPFLLCLILFPLFGSSQISTIWLKDRAVPIPSTIDSSLFIWNAQQPGYAKLSEHAKQWLYWTNYARKNPRQFWDSAVSPILVAFPELSGKYSASLQIDLYKADPLPFISLNTSLIQTAQYHATDIAVSNSKPSHNSSNGDDFAFRMKKAGIIHCAAENISLGNHSILLSLVLLYLDIDLPALGHRKNLLNPSFSDLGIGISVLRDGSLFSVQDFSCTQQH